MFILILKLSPSLKAGSLRVSPSLITQSLIKRTYVRSVYSSMFSKDSPSMIPYLSPGWLTAEQKRTYVRSEYLSMTSKDSPNMITNLSPSWLTVRPYHHIRLKCRIIILGSNAESSYQTLNLNHQKWPKGQTFKIYRVSTNMGPSRQEFEVYFIQTLLHGFFRIFNWSASQVWFFPH